MQQISDVASTIQSNMMFLLWRLSFDEAIYLSMPDARDFINMDENKMKRIEGFGSEARGTCKLMYFEKSLHVFCVLDKVLLV